jgi:Ca2+-transporting ATPase
MRYSIFKAPPHKWLILALIWELVLITVLVQFSSVRDAFGIIKPSASDLGVSIGLGVVLFISMEVIKAILRRKYLLKESRGLMTWAKFSRLTCR